MANSFETNVKLLQAFAGVEPDGDFRGVSAQALVDKLGLEPLSVPVGAIKVCIDPGHGMSNRKFGVYDPGCVHGSNDEAPIALSWAFELEKALIARGIPVFLTRRSADDHCPVATRASRAQAANCTHLISIHVNDADSAEANGTETLYRDDESFARRVHDKLTSVLKLKNRGLKHRTDLAVLNFRGQACLIELGFIKHFEDLTRFTSFPLVQHACREIASIF